MPDRVASQELDVGQLGRSLRRNKAWIIAATLVCCGLAVLFVSLVRPRYTADAKVIVENGESYFTRPDKSDVQQQALPDDEAVQSQVQLISSRDIAREAIRRLNLKGNTEFDPQAGSLDAVSRVLAVLGLQRDPTSVSPEDRILQAYYDRLMVFSVIKTRVITIEFTASDPELAARAANTIAEIYIEAQSEAKRRSAGSAADSLGTLVADLRARSAAADAKADSFRSQNGLLVGTNNNTITSQQLADISTQLAQSRTAEADAQAKARLIRDMIRQGRVSEVPDVANNELIRRISEQRVTLRAEIAQQGRTLLPGHPRMQELNAQLQDVDSQLRAAAEKAVRTLENDARIATNRVENLGSALETQKKTASTAGADQVQLNTLELQARLLKEQLEFNTAKYQEALARVAAASTPADARVISRADPPQQPSFPKKLPIILISGLAGLIFSVSIVMARELLSGRAFVLVEDDRATGEQDIGLRPALDPPLVPVPPVPPAPDPVAAEPGLSPPRPPRSMLVADELVAQLAERRARQSGALRVLLTTPSPRRFVGPAALGLARALAPRGRSILVDVDNHRPAVLPPQIAAVSMDERTALLGLSELLAGDATFAEIIHRDSGSRLHVVPTGGGDLPDTPDDLYGLTVAALAETYDYVFLHAPAVGQALTRLLSHHSDVVVLLAESEQVITTADVGRDLDGVEAAAILLGVAGTLLPSGMTRIVAA